MELWENEQVMLKVLSTKQIKTASIVDDLGLRPKRQLNLEFTDGSSLNLYPVGPRICCDYNLSREEDILKEIQELEVKQTQLERELTSIRKEKGVK